MQGEDDALPAEAASICSCILCDTLLCDSTGGAQVLPVHIARNLCSALIASIYVMAGIPELVDLAFNLTAGHIDTHVLMTLAVFGTLAIGSALEVGPGRCTESAAVAM